MGHHLNLIGLAVVICATHSASVALAWGLPVRGEDLPLYYDESTGNVTIDTTNISGGEFVAYSFFYTAPIGGPYLFENHTPFMPNLLPVGASKRSIQESSWPNEPLRPGVYSIGNILPANLTMDELTEMYFGESGFRSWPDAYSAFTYGAYGSFDLDPAQFHVFDLNYAPSPFPPINRPDGQVDEEDKGVTWATEASIAYDPSDGSVMLDTTGPKGGRIFGYQIQLRDDLFDIDQFKFASGELFQTIQPNFLSEAAGIDAGVYDLGPILPTGLDQDRLSSIINNARYIGEPGHGRDAIDVSVNGLPLAVSVVPEPTGAHWLAMVAGLTTILLRRRRHHSRVNGILG